MVVLPEMMDSQEFDRLNEDMLMGVWIAPEGRWGAGSVEPELHGQFVRWVDGSTSASGSSRWAGN